MKKILVIVLLVLSLVGCVKTIGKDNYFVVTKVERYCNYTTSYGYIVTIRTTALGGKWNYYKIITDENYRVGDTLKLTIK